MKSGKLLVVVACASLCVGLGYMASGAIGANQPRLPDIKANSITVDKDGKPYIQTSSCKCGPECPCESCECK